MVDGQETEATTIRATTGTHTRLYLTFDFCLSPASFIQYLSFCFLDALPPVTGLSVTDSTENSVLLGWSLVTGATGYILRWTEEEGDYSESLGTVVCGLRIRSTIIVKCIFLVLYALFLQTQERVSLKHYPAQPLLTV